MGKAIEELAHFVGRRAGATDRDRWSGRDRLRAGLADGGPAHGGSAQRPDRALDRV